jgi:hypothetical protein
MLNIPSELLKSYVVFLEKWAVPLSQFNDYKKGLRYYLDYCAKYSSPVGGSKSLTQFLAKLKEKNDLYPLHTQQDGERGQKSFGFLILKEIFDLFRKGKYWAWMSGAGGARRSGNKKSPIPVFYGILPIGITVSVLSAAP